MLFPAALPSLSLSDGIAPWEQMAFTQMSDLCPHSPLGIEITMTRHPPVQEEPRALPVAATLHTVGITAVSKVGEAFSFSLASCFVSRACKLSESQWLCPELPPEHQPHTIWESAHLDQSLAQFFSAMPCQLPVTWSLSRINWGKIRETDEEFQCAQIAWH